MEISQIINCPKDNGCFLINEVQSTIQCEKCRQTLFVKDGITVFGNDLLHENEINKKQRIFYETLNARESMVSGKDVHESVLNKIWAKIRDNYGDSQSHDKLSNFFISQLEQLSNKKVLEIGCGAGTPGTEYCLSNKDKLNYYIGIDMAINPLNKLYKKLKEANASNFYLFNMNIEDDYLINNQFDLIFGRGILHHFDSPDKIAKKINKLLAPGGKAVFLEPLNTNICIKILRLMSRPFRPNLIWEHPFSFKDLNKFVRTFRSSTLYYFDGLSTLSLLFFFNKKLFNSTHDFLNKLDKIFSRKQFYHKTFLRVVIVAKK